VEYKKTILIPASDFDYYEKHLKNGLCIEGVNEFGIAEVYAADFPDNIKFEIKVCNASDEGGGAWIDPVLFEAEENNLNVFGEVAVGEVGDTLDTEYSLEYNDNTYTVIVARGE